jgi:hypothetical protein
MLQCRPANPPGDIRWSPQWRRKLFGGGRIRCPHCQWEPTRGDLWACVCGHFWHTFDTGGQCPACQKQWSETQCPKCAAWSAHEAWYAEEPRE